MDVLGRGRAPTEAAQAESEEEACQEAARRRPRWHTHEVDELGPWPLRSKPTTEPAAEPTYVPPSRQTKKTFTAWMDKDALTQLKRLSEHKKISQQKLIAEAFNLLFEKHGLPPIAS